VSNSSLFTPALLRTHSFVFFALHETCRIFISPFISKASRRVSSFFLSVQLSQPYVATGHTSAFISRIFVESDMLWLFHISAVMSWSPALCLTWYGITSCIYHLLQSGTKGMGTYPPASVDHFELIVTLQFVVYLEIHHESPLSPSPLGCWTNTAEGKPCLTPFLTQNHSDNVPATLILASCFLYSLASKSIKCRAYSMCIIVTQSLSCAIEFNAFLHSCLAKREHGTIVLNSKTVRSNLSSSLLYFIFIIVQVLQVYCISN